MELYCLEDFGASFCILRPHKTGFLLQVETPEKQLQNLEKISFISFHLLGLAKVTCLTQNYDLSIEYQELALEIARSDSDKSKSYRFLADVYTETGHFNNAFHYYNQSLEIDKKLYGENSVEVAKLYRRLGLFYCCKEMYREALNYCKQSLVIQKKELPKNHYEIGKTYDCMGRIHEERKKWNISLDYYLKADEVYRAALLSNHPTMLTNYKNLNRGKSNSF
jgi:tetratricopeptide (TPR) repeat protein